MPLYDYHCPDCRKRFEVQVKLSDWDKPIPCKYCGKPLIKIVTAPMFRMG